jgi:hypothetical protein
MFNPFSAVSGHGTITADFAGSDDFMKKVFFRSVAGRAVE